MKIAEAKQKADARVMTTAKQRLPEYLQAALEARASINDASAIAHWPFDETDKTVVSATFGPDGRLSNLASGDAGPRPTRTDGQIGRALRFDGKSDVVSINASDLSAVDFGTNLDFSISFWLKSAPGYQPKTADTVLAAKYPSAMWFVALRPEGVQLEDVGVPAFVLDRGFGRRRTNEVAELRQEHLVI